MSTDKQTQVLKLALEALERVNTSPSLEDWHHAFDEEVTAIREALVDSALERMAENARELGLDYEAAPVAEPHKQQEPVAVARVDDLERGGRVRALAMGLGLDQPLYTSPPAQRTWIGVTDEEIEQVCVPLGAAMLSFTEVARAIEAKLKEKNGF